MFRKLDDDWNLFAVHFFIIDGYNHLFFNKQRKMLELYPELDELVSNIKARLPKDVFFLVISDHGSQNGLHTDYGFYSSNITLGLKNPHICDFYPLILRMAHAKEIRSLSEPVEKSNAKKTHYEYAEKDAEEIKKD